MLSSLPAPLAVAGVLHRGLAGKITSQALAILAIRWQFSMDMAVKLISYMQCVACEQ
jgi:hypothetical protein